MKFQKHLFLFLFLTIVCGRFDGFGQSTREELEKRRLELKQEITKINSLLADTQQKEKSVLTKVSDLDKRIKTTENLIAVINREANLLTREINKNQRDIEKLRKELKKLKEDYAKMIVRSQKSGSRQNRLMFLFSSESFLQAYKRLQYMKQYANYRKEQGLRIKNQTQVLQVLNKKLIVQKKDKENLLVEKQEVREKLREDKKTQQALVASIMEQEDKFTSQINENQRKINEIDRKIDELIRETIAEENKKKGSTGEEVFELTPAAKALAADFESNKGKLPWPVKSGVVSMSFGTHPHPIVSSLKVNSNGVRIRTEENAEAKAVFEGEVSRIMSFRGAHLGVMIKHGNYITIYQNLTDVPVKKGDRIRTGEVLGKVGKSTATGKTTLYFFVFKNTQKLDPADWIYQM